MTFNYNKASWNANTAKKCNLNSSGKCSVTSPTIPNISGTAKNGKVFSQLFSIKEWNTSSTATTSTLAANTSIEVTANKTYYAIVTLAKTSFKINADLLRQRSSAGSSNPVTGQLCGMNVPSIYSCWDYRNYAITINDFKYVASESYPLWIRISDYTAAQCIRETSTDSITCKNWSAAYYLDWKQTISMF